MLQSLCVNIKKILLLCSVLKPVVPPPVPRSPSDSSALPAASCGVAQAALFPPGGSGGGEAQAAIFPPGGGGAAQAALFPNGRGGGVAQAALLPPGGGVDGPSHILNGRLARHAGPPPLPLAAALPPPHSAAAAAAGVANCDIALQYQRLFEEQRDLSPLTQQLNNHCATSATAAAPAVAPTTAKYPPPSPGQQQRRLSAPNNGPQVVGGNRRAATLASRRRSSAAVQRKAGRSPESPPLSTYPPPPSDYGLPVTQSFPVPACSPSPESLAHRCRAGPELYLRNGETYIGPDYSTTTLPHRVSVLRYKYAKNPIFTFRF
jgi:hypothetical protein